MKERFGRWAAGLAALLLTAATQAADGPQKLAAIRLQAGIHNISAELAITPEQREIGLMNRSAMGTNEGMLFVFEQAGFYPFWMKNTLIPLDIIWIDEGWRIVSIAESVPPCRADPCPTYPPAGNARYVVEVAAGFARTHRVARGDQLKVTGLPPGAAMKP